MSKQVDERVVSMEFDNKHFESNVQTSLRTVEKLKQSLNLKGAAKGFEEIDSASKKVNMSSLGQAVEAVGVKFSALQVMATTALANITNTAVNAGMKIAKALTIDPIQTGLSEYETKINAIQVIKANTRSKYDSEEKQMADITAALDELNDYADRTIYNYSQMTNNVGKFVAQGLGVKEATNAVQGMANLAGASGASAEDMARATYQMSQALGGTIRLMDWNSLRNANMATTELKNTLMDLAKVNGVAIDDMIAKHGTFEQTLSEGWLTGEMFTQAMNIYSDVYSEAELKAMGFNDAQVKNFKGLAQMAKESTTEVKTISQLWDVLKETAQSGWTQTWELIVGDFDTAKKTFTQLQVYFSNILNGWSEARNTILGGVLDFGSVWGKITDKIENSGLGKIKDVAEKAAESVDKVEKKLEDFQDIVNKVWKGDFATSDTGRFEMLEKAGYDSRVVQDLVNKGYNYKITMEDVEASHKKFGLTLDKSEKSTKKMSSAIGELSDTQLEAAGLTKAEITVYRDLEREAKRTGKTISEVADEMSKTDGRTLIVETFKNAWSGLVNIFKIVKKIWEEVFPPVSVVRIYSMIKAVHDFSERMKNITSVSEGVKETFKGIFAALGVGLKLIGFVVKGVIGLVKIIAPAFFALTGYIGEAIFALDEFLEKNKVLDKILTTIKNAFSNIGKFITDVCTTIRDKFTDAVNINTDGIEKFSSKVKKRFEPLVLIAGFIKEAFVLVGKVVLKIGQTIGKVLGNIVDGVCNAFQNADYSTIFDMINTGLVGGFIVMLTRFVNSFKKISDNVGGFLDEIKAMLGDVRGILQSYQESIKANTLMQIAKAVGILALSLLVLSFIDSDKLTGSLLALTGLFTELMMGMKVFTDMSENKDFKGMFKLSAAMQVLASAIFIMSIALLILSKMSWSELGVGLTALAGGLGVLIGAMWALPNEKKLNKAVRALKNLAGAMIILAIALKIMGSLSWKELGVGLTGMGVGLGIMVGALHLIPKDVGIKAMSLIPLATAMVILGAALKIMGSMSWSEMGAGLTALAGSLIAIVGAMRLMPKNLFTTGIGLIAVATSLTIVASALNSFGSMTWTEIAKGLVALGASLGILAGGMHAMKTALAGAFAMTVMSVALALFVPQLRALGTMSWKEVGVGLVALAGAFAVLGIAAYALSPVLPVIIGLSASLLMIGVATAAIGTGILVLSTGLTALAGSGTAIVGMLVLLVKSVASLVPFLFEQLAAGIVAFCGVIIQGAPAIGEAIGAIISTILDIFIQNIPKIIAGILQLVTDALSALIEYAPIIVDKIFDLIIVIINGIAARTPELIQSLVNLLMAVCQGVVDALATMDKDVLVEGLAGIGVLAAIMAAIAAVSGLIPLAMIGLVGMGLIIAEMALVFSALGKIFSNTSLIDSITTGGDIMGAVGTAIGKFVGGLAGGFMGGMSAQLPQIGTDLSNFMKNIQPFIEGAKLIDMSVVAGVAALTGCILAITAANLMDGLTSWLTGGVDFADFGKKIAEFGPYLAQYAESVAGINGEAVTASATAAKALAEMTSEIPNEGGVAAWFAGENSISKFASEIVLLGEGLKGFSDAVVGIVPENIIAAAEAGKALAEMASTIPNEGGVAAWFAGENSISKFATELIVLGEGLKGFSDSVKDITPETVIAASKAGVALAEMASTIPNEGGVAAWFAGENSVSKFSTDLIALGEGLKGFSDEVKDVVPENVIAASKAGKALAEMANTIPNEGGVAAWFAGENSLSKFSGELPKLGEGLKSFADKVKGIEPESVTAAAKAGKSLAQMTDTLPKNTDRIVGFGENLKSFGASLKVYFEKISGVSLDVVSVSNKAVNAVKKIGSDIKAKSIESAVSAVKKVIDMLDDMSSVKADSATNFTKAIKELGKSGVEKMIKAFEDGHSKLKKAGKDAVDKIIDGMEAKETDIEDAAKALVKACKEAIDEKKSSFESAGKNVVKGFANGISKNTYLAEAKAKAMAEAAEKAAKKALDEHSPSKKFDKIGDFAGVAFVNGLGRYITAAGKTGTEIANSSMNGLKSAISSIGRVVSGNIDAEPTIRPVLDLSSVREGAASIGNMFAGRRTLSVDTAFAGAVSASMSARQNGMDANDIVSALNKLRKDVANMPRESYNINGITYDDDSVVTDAIRTLVGAAKRERRT